MIIVVVDLDIRSLSDITMEQVIVNVADTTIPLHQRTVA